MLGIAEELELQNPLRAHGIDESRDGAVAAAFDGTSDTCDDQVGFARHLLGFFGGAEVEDLDRGRAVDIFRAKGFEHVGGREFGALAVGQAVNDRPELAVHCFRQRVAVFLLQHVGDAAFAGLGIDANDGLVVAADVGGIDGNVEYVPRVSGRLLVPRFLDGVLVGAGERGEDQIARVRLAVGPHPAGGAVVDFADFVEVGEIELRIDP